MKTKLAMLSFALIGSFAFLTGCSSTSSNSGEESVSSILKQGIAVGKTGYHTLQAVNKQCQQQLKTNGKYKAKIATVGNAYKQRKVRFSVCECVVDNAMESISDEQLEKAVGNPNYKAQLIKQSLNNSLNACVVKVVNPR